MIKIGGGDYKQRYHQGVVGNGANYLTNGVNANEVGEMVRGVQ